MSNMSFDNISLSYYGKKLPEEDTLVLGRVIEYGDAGIELVLPEYQGYKCVIGYRDACKSARASKIKNQLKRGHEYTFLVKGVVEETGFLELIRRDLNSDDDKKYLVELEPYRFHLSMVHSFLIKEGVTSEENKTTILEQTIWKYPRDEVPSVFEAIYHGEKAIGEVFDTLDGELARKLEVMIESKYGATDSAKGTVNFKIMSYELDGVVKIRTFLRQIETKMGVEACLRTPPDYYMIITGIKKIEREAKEAEVAKLLSELGMDLAGVLVRYEGIQWH